MKWTSEAWNGTVCVGSDVNGWNCGAKVTGRRKLQYRYIQATVSLILHSTPQATFRYRFASCFKWFMFLRYFAIIIRHGIKRLNLNTQCCTTKCIWRGRFLSTQQLIGSGIVSRLFRCIYRLLYFNLKKERNINIFFFGVLFSQWDRVSAFWRTWATMANFSYFYLEPNAADVYLAGAGASFWIDRSTEHMQIIAKFEAKLSCSQPWGGGGGGGGEKALKMQGLQGCCRFYDLNAMLRRIKIICTKIFF